MSDFRPIREIPPTPPPVPAAPTDPAEALMHARLVQHEQDAAAQPPEQP